MPRPNRLNEYEITFKGGFFPSAPRLAPGGLQDTIQAGSGVWLRAFGGTEVANGLSQLSATNVGARIFAADTQRAVIAGGLNGDLLPYAGLIRYLNFVLLYLSENTSAQVYLDEVAVTGLTTSSVAGRLRVAIPDGVGGYNVFDAGFDKPVLTSADVTFFTGGAGVQGQKPMAGSIGVAIAPWRSTTEAVGPPSEVVYQDIPPTGSSFIRIDPPSAVSGQTGWVFGGTRWNDQSGQIRVVRYVYLTPRGTFTATNGSDAITAGVGTFWNDDLRAHDLVVIDGGAYEIEDITGNGTATLTSNFTGVTNPGKTMTIGAMAANWYDSELRALVDRDIERPRRAAGVLPYADRVILWGIPDTIEAFPTDVTGNSLIATLDRNPEHIRTASAIVTASKSDLLNVLATDGPLYLMTTTSLELLTFTNDPNTPFNLKIIAEPGFAAGTNGVLYLDYYYGYNGRPLRTRAEENIDVQFAAPVLSQMEGWNPARVILAVDPKNAAVLYMHDDGDATEVIPYMAQLGVWGPPLNFDDRIIDTAVVNGELDLTYLTGGNYRVNEWEGGAGIGGDPYVASQYLDPNLLNSSRLKQITVAGKVESLSVFAATPDAAIPDVSVIGQAAATFTLSDTLKREATIFTNIPCDAVAFRADFDDSDGSLQKIVAGGVPRSERR